MRLYDRIMRLPIQMDDDIRETVEIAQWAGLFDVTNTFEYMSGLEEKARDDIEINDLPHLVPPYPTTWLEYSVSPGFTSDIARAHYRWNIRRAGLLLRVYDMDHDEESRAVYEEDFLPRIANSTKSIEQAARWFIGARQVFDLGGAARFEPYTRFWFMDSEGHPLVNRDTGQVVNALQPFAKVPDPQEFCEQESVWYVNRHTHLAPLFAISLLSCRNVTKVEAPDTRSRQQRRHDERLGVPTAKFYTLQIEPMKRVLKDEGGSEKHGLKKALHICRGHFAHYTEDKPLFGKYSGTFWRPAHVRGSADVGTVYKDYKVKGGAA